MPRDVRLFLHEIRQACDDVLESSGGRTLDDYLTDRQMRHAIEREVEPLREAVDRLLREYSGP